MQIDCSLDWKEQIKTASIKVSSFLKHAKNFLPGDTVENLYSGIVEPHLLYCCSVWGSAGLTGINQLQKIQNRATRIATNSNYDAPDRPLIQSLRWKAIQGLIQNGSLIMIYRSLKGMAPKSLSDLFTENFQCFTYSLRNAVTDLRLPKKDINWTKNLFLRRSTDVE